MITTCCRWIAQRCCKHPHDLRRAAAGRMWLECAVCGRETAGIVVMRGSEAPPRDPQLEMTVVRPRAAQAAA
jgi:hypothetical protein